ncbi:ferredoxin [Rhodococcus koreensis]
MAFIITEACIDILDKACVLECPVNCIYEGDRMMYIHPDECVDCGACEPVCPQEAIFYEDEIPEELSGFRDANKQFFDQLGTPGGGKELGKQSHDADLVVQILAEKGAESA